MTTPPAHDEFCPPGLKLDDPATCWICIGLAKARADERNKYNGRDDAEVLVARQDMRKYVAGQLLDRLSTLSKYDHKLKDEHGRKLCVPLQDVLMVVGGDLV